MSVKSQAGQQIRNRYREVRRFAQNREFFAECRVMSKLHGIGELDVPLVKLEQYEKMWHNRLPLIDKKYQKLLNDIHHSEKEVKR